MKHETYTKPLRIRQRTIHREALDLSRQKAEELHITTEVITMLVTKITGKGGAVFIEGFRKIFIRVYILVQSDYHIITIVLKIKRALLNAEEELYKESPRKH